MPNSPQPKNWRDVLPIHPAAELFPRMSESELRELGEDIKKRGLQQPIVLWSPGYCGDGKKDRPRYVLDGINRLDACERAGIEFLSKGSAHPNAPAGLKAAGRILESSPVRVKQLYERRIVLNVTLGGRAAARESVEPAVDPYAFVLSANIHRRHLTAQQKRELIAKLIKQTPNKSDRQIAKQTETSPTTVGKIRKESEATGDVSKLDTRTDTKGRDQPSTKPKKSAKPTSPAKNDPIGSSPVRDSEVPAISVPPESRSGSISAKDIALEDFSARAMELVQLTKKQHPERFANTALSFEDIRRLGHFLLDLANVCEKKRQAEYEAKREAECAALFGEAAQ